MTSEVIDATTHASERDGHETSKPLGTAARQAITVTAFGTATEVTLSELAIETFFPADAATAAAVREHAAALSAPR